MRVSHAQAVEEIASYLTGLRFPNPLNTATNKAAFLSSYKRFHSLLIWTHALSLNKRGALKESDPALFAQESVSDLSHAYLLTLMGAYKPARGMCRSAAENVFRSCFTLQAKKAPSFSTVHELISETRTTTNAKNKILMAEINQLAKLYAKLCDYVHSSSKAHMALKIPFAEIIKFSRPDYLDCLGDIRLLSECTNKILFWLQEEKLRPIDHRHRDYILDTTPPTLKRAASERMEV
jgi:hypothetical protein